ncbi:phosphotyrosine interaction domain (PTB/PID) domain-containing protein [Ditylenchus destructor]|nr:phosphotyrosine interaction domain (PTB/PID) domain-containing protein [Ditylenchus destructor]
MNGTKEVYKTIKRSISATTSGLVNGTSKLTNSSSSSKSDIKHWIHPPELLTQGKVTYACRFLGQIEVSEPKGTHVVRDAIHAIRFRLQVNRGITGHSGSKLRKVEIQISIDGLTVSDKQTNAMLHKHPLHRISFCADDKQDKKVFSYIAKTGQTKHECFVFLSDKMAEEITLTIGEAFDLAYEKYVKKRGKELEEQRQLILLRKRVAELEEENGRLKAELSGYKFRNSNGGSHFDDLPNFVPSLPSTPIPPVPAILAGNKPNAGHTPPPLEPPPPQPPRRSNPVHSQSATANNPNQPDMLFTLNDLFNRERQGPDVDTRLKNLQLHALEDLFDDEFDPRAEEKRSASEPKESITEPNKQTSNNSIQDFEELLKRVDAKLSEMQAGFSYGKMASGDTGDCGTWRKDLGDMDETNTPQPSCSTSNNAP